MRISGFDVSVVRKSDGTPLPEVTSGSNVFIVAESGIEFEVLVAGPAPGSHIFMVHSGSPLPALPVSTTISAISAFNRQTEIHQTEIRI